MQESTALDASLLRGRTVLILRQIEQDFIFAGRLIESFAIQKDRLECSQLLEHRLVVEVLILLFKFQCSGQGPHSGGLEKPSRIQLIRRFHLG